MYLGSIPGTGGDDVKGIPEAYENQAWRSAYLVSSDSLFRYDCDYAGCISLRPHDVMSAFDYHD